MRSGMDAMSTIGFGTSAAGTLPIGLMGQDCIPRPGVIQQSPGQVPPPSMPPQKGLPGGKPPTGQPPIGHPPVGHPPVGHPPIGNPPIVDPPGAPPVPGTWPTVPPPPAGPDQGPGPGVPVPNPPHVPDGSTPPPGPDPDPGPEPGPKPGPDKPDGGSVLPWLLGAGAVVGAGALGVAAIRSGSRNIRGLHALDAAFQRGTIHQGGLQAISDARIGAHVADVGAREHLMVALPVVNRIGSAGRLTAVARGHLDHAEFMSAATALRRGEGDAVYVHEPMREHVLARLERGDGMPAVLAGLQRSAGDARPALKNKQIAQYADQASIVEFGPRTGGRDIRSGTTLERPTLAVLDGEIVETGGTSQVDWLFAGRGADLDGRGLAQSLGTIQGLNVSTLPHPMTQARAVNMARVDPELVEEVGLPGAFTARWQHRLGAH